MSTQVDEIRRQIDNLDNKIHDLLMERASLVMRIGKAKRENNIQFVQPSREAVMLRRLLSRHDGPLPKEAVVRIWRELVGAVSLLQTGLKVVVCVDPEDAIQQWDMAKDFFSSVLPMKKMTDPLAALAAVRDGNATFAVMPWPEIDQERPWWSFLIEEQAGVPMKIMARLPFGDRTKSVSGAENKCLAVARVSYEPSGEDISFIALRIDSTISRTRIIECFKKQGLSVISLYGHICSEKIITEYLLEVDDYVGEGDERLEKIILELDKANGKGISLGGYPVPPVYMDLVGKGAEESNAIDKKSA
jgi:chorismate mutase-like protein